MCCFNASTGVSSWFLLWVRNYLCVVAVCFMCLFYEANSRGSDNNPMILVWNF